jgi:hypothetical protein
MNPGRGQKQTCQEHRFQSGAEFFSFRRMHHIERHRAIKNHCGRPPDPTAMDGKFNRRDTASRLYGHTSLF